MQVVCGLRRGDPPGRPYKAYGQWRSIDWRVAEAGDGWPAVQEMLVDQLRYISWADVGVPDGFGPCGVDDHVGAIATLAEAAAEGDTDAALCVAMLQVRLDFLKGLLCALLMAGRAGADEEMGACGHTQYSQNTVGAGYHKNRSRNRDERSQIRTA